MSDRPKPKVGQELYALVPPSHHANEEVRKVVVSKVGTKYFRCEYNAKGQMYDLGASYNVKTWDIVEGTIVVVRHARLFESEAEILNFKLAQQRRKEVMKRLDDYLWRTSLDDQAVDRLHAAIFQDGSV